MPLDAAPHSLAAAAWVTATRAAFAPLADAERAVGAQAYMKDVAPFLGIAAPARRAAQRAAWGPLAPLDPAGVASAALSLWSLPEREYQYAACELIGRHVPVLPATFVVDPLRRLVTDKSWWDTVDLLESEAVVPLVKAHPELVEVMWTWLADDDRWLVRTAVQHQRGRRADTDFARLYAMCDAVARDCEFFVAKAVGWALRDACPWDPAGVRAFVDAHPDLPAVARREAVRGLARVA